MKMPSSATWRAKMHTEIRNSDGQFACLQCTIFGQTGIEVGASGKYARSDKGPFSARTHATPNK
jgi:hypothetical protein